MLGHLFTGSLGLDHLKIKSHIDFKIEEYCRVYMFNLHNCINNKKPGSLLSYLIVIV